MGNHFVTRFQTRRDSINHLREEHNEDVDKQSLKFPVFSEFLLWKQQEETKTHSNYVQMCAPRTSAIYQHHYYYCNRSGK